MKLFYYILFLFSFSFLQAQDSTRVVIKGKIIVNSPDIEGVTIYNKSSNIGTVTDLEGNFEIKGMLNDKINVHSLQFIDFDIVVAQDILDSKQMNIYLVEQINNLDEVVILPYDLSGVLTKDIKDAEVFDTNLEGVQALALDISAYEFADDQYSKVENYAAMSPNERIRYQANGMALLQGLAGLIFKKKSKSKIDNQIKELTGSLQTKYDHGYYTTNFSIPEEKVEAFIAYVETNNFDSELLKKGKELQLIEHLNNQSSQFLKLKVEKK